MTPNLLQATQEYWRKLDAVEAAYKRNELSPQEVDAEVKALMAELGQARRESLAMLRYSLQNFWHEQRETIIGVAVLLALSYGWLLAR